ncbi:15.7 kDa heat shock protein, peroxisomal [Vitis vinifera]|uniref:15.7 kDa heat shock protein, peroxisomal n=1 Tax=Vitis vinifera TaxID=29760 RepID=A0A438JY24_VITVI|nr:15.7 kDa heat shock protein, peroxisomal [Vitis vinifera]
MPSGGGASIDTARKLSITTIPHLARRIFWGAPVFRDLSGSTAPMDWLESQLPTSSNSMFEQRRHKGGDRRWKRVARIQGGRWERGVRGERHCLAYSRKRGGRGEFSREFELPENVKVDQIKAQVENGVLTIVVPKDTSPKASKVKTINISSKL